MMLKVRLDPQDEARLDKLITLGTLILSSLGAIATSTKSAEADVDALKEILVGIAADVHELVAPPPPDEAVGIEITPGTPTPRTTQENKKMAATVTVKLTKKGVGQGQRVASKATKASDPLTAFSLQDNQDDTYTVQGEDAAGFPVDISGVATLTPAPTSADSTVLTVDAPTGMTFAVHGLKPGESDVTATATWNDGSLGPFTFTLPTTVTAGPAGGIVITPGTPTVR